MLMQCASNHKQNAYFLTLKGPSAKHQKIGFVNDIIRKVSKTYIIIRERNKIAEGYHFHAVFNAAKAPGAKWFKKGVHMNLQKIGVPPVTEGSTYTIPVPDLTSREVEDMAYYDGVADAISYLEDVLIRKGRKANRKATHVEKTLRYMSKDLDMPMQYTDYIYVVAGKNKKLTGG